MFLKVEPQNGVEILRGSRVPASMFGSSIAIFDLLMKMSENQSPRGISGTLAPLYIGCLKKTCWRLILYSRCNWAVAGQQPR